MGPGQTAYDILLARPMAPLVCSRFSLYTLSISRYTGKAVTFDAQCDLAAVVYGPDDDPDGLLTDFANDLTRSGHRMAGVIQVGRTCQSEERRLSALVLPGDEIVPLVQGLPPCTTGCRLDAGLLAGVAKQVTAAISRGPDLVIINRFGRNEAGGGGLSDLIVSALNAEIPVLIAVSEHRFAALIKFSEGMTVRLACRRDALDRWWQSVTGCTANRSPNGARTFCEILK